MPPKKTERTNYTQTRNNDVFNTPPEMIDDIVNALLIGRGFMNPTTDSVLDPCSGELRGFFNSFPNGDKSELEITRGNDFFEETRKFDWVVGNPPYSGLTPWFEKTLTVAEKGFCYIVFPFSLTINRMRMCKEAGFSLVYSQVVRVKSWKFGFPCIVVVFMKNPPNGNYNLLEDFY